MIILTIVLIKYRTNINNEAIHQTIMNRIVHWLHLSLCLTVQVRGLEIASMVLFGPMTASACWIMKWKIACTHIFNVLLGLTWAIYDYLFISLKLRIGQIDEDFFEVFTVIWCLFMSVMFSTCKYWKINEDI